MADSLSNVENLPINELRIELKKRNLSTKGKKSKLIARLKSNEMEEPGSSSEPDGSNSETELSDENVRLDKETTKRSRGRPRKNIGMIDEVQQLISDVESNLSAMIIKALAPLRSFVQDHIKTINTRLHELEADIKKRLDELDSQIRAQVSTIPTFADATAANHQVAGAANTQPIHPKLPNGTNPNRKFNIIIFGIKESPKGTPKLTRSDNDVEAVSDILSSMHQSITEYSVRDCYRLGRYSEDRRRPVLVTMTRSQDVALVLANRKKLAQRPEISVKPDLSREARQIQSILLKERRAKITSGTSPHSIKLRNDSLYIDGRKHGIVVDSTYQQCPLISDFIPPINTCNVTSHPEASMSEATSNPVSTSNHHPSATDLDLTCQ